MSDHFISINRGKDGLVDSDLTVDTSAHTGNDIELRIADGAGLTKKDVVIALEAFERLLEDARRSTFIPL